MIHIHQPAMNGIKSVQERPLWPDILKIQDELETADEKKRIELMLQLRNINYHLNHERSPGCART